MTAPRSCRLGRQRAELLDLRDELCLAGHMFHVGAVGRDGLRDRRRRRECLRSGTARLRRGPLAGP